MSTHKNDLDDELAQAVDATATVVGAPPQAHGPAPRRASTVGIGAVIALVAVAGGIALMVLFGFKQAAVYAVQTDELKARSNELVGRKVRVDGELVQGSLEKKDSPCEYRFRIQSKGQELPVSFKQCIVPDTFRDKPGVKVTVTGKLDKDGHFEATEILAKCASKYDPKSHEITMSDGTKVKATDESIKDLEVEQQ